MASRVEERLGEKLRAAGKTLAAAESCSGGLIAHRITDVSGSSDYFLGGIVSYSNESKVALLGVPSAVLEAHGAVSEPVARAMASGAKQAFGADYAFAVTGVAGPTGGTQEKPVGLVYIAVATPGETEVRRCQFAGNRAAIKEQTAEEALKMLLETLE